MLFFRIILVSVCYFLGSCVVFGQSDALMDSLEQAHQKAYKQRIAKKYLSGKYIPKDIIDACEELDRLGDPKGIEKIKRISEDEMVKKLHFGLGKWISHNWSFYEGSRYAHYLREQGISHPDDMVQITLRMWHRHLLGKDFEFTKEVQRIVLLRAEEWERKQKERLIYLGPKK